LSLVERYGRTNIHNAIALGLVPGVAALLFLVWWLAASRARWRTRLAGLALVIAAIAGVVFSQSSIRMGGMLLAFSLPYFVYGVAGVLLLTVPLRPHLRERTLALAIIICAGIFCSMRVDSIGGDLFPVVSWRWEPTAGERSAALVEIDAQGIAEVPETPATSDWPDFLGHGRHNWVEGVRFSTDWSVPPRELWRRDIGAGWSSFIAVGNYLFTQEQRGEEELVTCYRRDTGELVWMNRNTAHFEDGMGMGPRATPAFAGGRLYTQGVTGLLQCVDGATGQTIWKRDLKEDADRDIPGFGFSSSPLVAGEWVVVFTAGGEHKSVIAYDRATGNMVWSAGRDTNGYSSPHLAMLAGMPQVLMTNDYGMQSFNIGDGTVLWEHNWDIKINPRCVQAVVWRDEYVLFGGAGASGSRLLHVTREKENWNVSEKWTTRRFGPYFNNGVLYGDHYYGYDDKRLGCLCMETGERRWAGERYGGQLVFVKDMEILIILSEDGHIVLVRATPERFEEVTRFRALTSKTWNHPIIHRGRLYVRNAREAACFELPGP